MEEEEKEEQGMDTAYIGILVVVFLALAALAIDVGYMYVTDDDLRSAAETSSLEGAKAIKQRMLAQIRTDPQKANDVASDLLQPAARTAAIEAASGTHHATALIEVANRGLNRLAEGNDITVGFWDTVSRTYTPGVAPANAMQIRTRRTAENEAVGLGTLGSIFSKLTGSETANFTPDAVAALPPMATANIALYVGDCDPACRYPNVCTIPERKMSRDPLDAGQQGDNRYIYTSLLHSLNDRSLSDVVCMDLPPQEVCRKEIFTTSDADNRGLRDIESMMYNPNTDASNKEFDEGGAISGWWVIVPVIDSPPQPKREAVEKRTVTRYALVRIRRICVGGTAGCQQNGTAFKAPPSACRGEEGLYIDRISYVECGSKDLRNFPGLRPVLVEEENRLLPGSGAPPQ
ncbi:Tad domain-containing protein [Geobacter sp. SVR]|uniref:Tad domain-containing protein n=1 Tax=Geobacter sp. SVR TaxID=2495594 RepID=UPI00143EF8E7|nr:Tad domain-containing protein [Geobacter sp. SVR]BCS54943.1 hypothetical protein GSVR_32510 [Geobacter sp. SVR]GCF86142.1 hypothetical protein GSbR_27420 [Geobacter sp. SVR]